MCRIYVYTGIWLIWEENLEMWVSIKYALNHYKCIGVPTVLWNSTEILNLKIWVVFIIKIIFQLWDINVKAGFMLCKEAVPHMRERGYDYLLLYKIISYNILLR